MDDEQRTERVADLEALRVANNERITALLATGIPGIDFGPLFLETLVAALFPPGSDERLDFDLTWAKAQAQWLTNAEAERRRAAILAPLPPGQVPLARGNGRP